MQRAPSEIALGHELIHALRAMGGNMIYFDKETKTGYGSYSYLDEKDRMKPGYAKMEELATTGISYMRPDGSWADAGNWVTTENALRREHGYGRRVMY